MSIQMKDLHNPNNITAIMTTRGQFTERRKTDQGFQETNGRYELWQMMDRGYLMKVKGWNKKSVLRTYRNNEE